MRYATLLFFAIVLSASGLLTGGCVQTSMLPAQQLESGTTAVSASLDEPGFAYVPRLNARVTQGVGDGDVTVNLGGPFPLGGGLAGRYYLTDRVNAELQLQAATFFDEEGVRKLALLGVQEVPTGTDSRYIGGQLGVIDGAEFDFSGAGTPDRQMAPVIGALVGYGPVDLGSSWQMQVELAAHLPLSLKEGGGPQPGFRLSIGFFHFFQ